MSTFLNESFFASQDDGLFDNIGDNNDHQHQKFVSDNTTIPTTVDNQITETLVAHNTQPIMSDETLCNHLINLKVKLTKYTETVNGHLLVVRIILESLDSTGRKVTRNDRNSFQEYTKAAEIYFRDRQVAIDDYLALQTTYLQGKSEEYLPPVISTESANITRFLADVKAQVDSVDQAINKYAVNTTEIETPPANTPKKKRGRPATGTIKENHAKLVQEHDELKTRFRAIKRELEKTKIEAMKWKKEAETTRKSLDFTMVMQEKLEATREALRTENLQSVRRIEDKLESTIKDIRRENNDTAIAIRSEVSDKEKSLKSILKRDLRLRCHKMESKSNIITYAQNNDPNSLIAQLEELKAHTTPLLQFKKSKKRKLTQEPPRNDDTIKKRKRDAISACKETENIIIGEETSEFII